MLSLRILTASSNDREAGNGNTRKEQERREGQKEGEREGECL